MQRCGQTGFVSKQKLSVGPHSFGITFKECLKLIIGTALPIAIGIYTAVTNEQIQKSARLAAAEQQRINNDRQAFDLARAHELYQQQLYQNFLNDMYKLHVDGELNDSAKPWVFANARYRAAHREFDALRKGQALLFLKEKKMIGRRTCTTGCVSNYVEDIIRLNGLSFDSMNLKSEADHIDQLDLSCMEFNKVSMRNATFSFTNLIGVKFTDTRLSNVKFQGSSLNCAILSGTLLDGADFVDSNLNGTQFINVNLSTTILTPNQEQVATFQNVTKKNVTNITVKTTTGTTTIISTTSTTMSTSRTTTTILSTTTNSTKTSEITSTKKTTTTMDTVVTTSEEGFRPLRGSAVHLHPYARWRVTGNTVAGGNGSGDRFNQLSDPRGLFVADDQTIYVGHNSQTARIMEWKPSAPQGSIAVDGKGSENFTYQFHNVFDVIIDRESNDFIISDFLNTKVVRRTSGNATGRAFVITNINCVGLSLDETGALYLVGDLQNEVRRYTSGDLQGKVIAGGNGAGDRLNQFSRLKYIFVDQNHSIYVSDCGNNRVMKWIDGENQGIIVAGGHGQGYGLNQLSCPQGVVADQQGTVYVVDQGNDRVMRWHKGAMQGTIIAGGNGRGAESNQLNEPNSLSFDYNGNIYVVDSKNYRVQKFEIEFNG